MRLALGLAAVALTLVLASVFLAGPTRDPDRTAPSEPAWRQAARLDAPREPSGAEVRNVTPAGVTAPPATKGPLSRVEAPKPAPKAAAAPKPKRYFNPVVEAVGLLTTTDGAIRLAGIEAPSLDLECGEGNAAWPCGRMARTALRQFIRGRAIECAPADSESGDIPERRCTVGGADIAAWLVEHGWATAKADQYGPAGEQARSDGRGLWQASLD
ncbi:thermonuclease family protein [Faunimonas sp. B44]|uniref:thermonuclease family protein n=1 Tax=Faunimonas sp. B44 TaxID=3461493 RepID=UPI004043F8F7